MSVHLLRSVPDANIAEYGYPDGARVEVLQDELGPVHRIHYPAPSTAISDGSFDKAPNGSQILDMTANTGKLYFKTGTAGLCDGTWKYGAIAT